MVKLSLYRVKLHGKKGTFHYWAEWSEREGDLFRLVAEDGDTLHSWERLDLAEEHQAVAALPEKELKVPGCFVTITERYRDESNLGNPTPGRSYHGSVEYKVDHSIYHSPQEAVLAAIGVTNEVNCNELRSTLPHIANMLKVNE